MKKVLLINSVCGFGSTGRICVSIAEQMKAEGNEVFAAYGRGTTDYSNSYKFGSRISQAIHLVMTRILDAHGLCSRHATKKFIDWANKFDPDILWLHNIHGYYINYEMLFSWIKTRPDMQVKWTLHDCWSFTGHCAHYMTVDCEKWSDDRGCFRCPLKKRYPKSILWDNSRVNFEKKRKFFCGVKKLELIIPSEWLAGEVKKSFLKEYPLTVVKNKIDTSIFKPTKSNLRSELGLEEKIIILGVSSIWHERKGLYDYIDLAKLLGEEYCVILVGGGLDNVKKKLPSNMIVIDRTNSGAELAEIYTVADYFVNLTYEDNYPTVNLEAESCGTRVITYDVGGCSETIKNKGSLVVKKGNIDEILKILRFH